MFGLRAGEAQVAFTQVKQLTANDGAAEDQFGNAVAANGDLIVVGAREADVGGNLSQGAAYLFGRDAGGAGNWGLIKKLLASDGARGAGFGSSVSLSGNWLAVGALYDDAPNPNQGSVYVFERNAGGAENWGQVKKLTASDGAASDFFGVSVSLDQEVIVVGASGADVAGNGNQGAAYVFARNASGSNNWGMVQKLTASDGGRDDTYGSSVSVNGDVIVVGGRYHDVGANFDQGAAYLYERNAGGSNAWGLVSQLTASDGAAVDQFGFSVAVCGEVVVVGAYWDDVGPNADQGSAYVFERNAGGSNNWGQVCQLLAPDGAPRLLFGYSAGISGDKIIVGSPYMTVGAQGFAYVFGRDAGGTNWGFLGKNNSR